MIKRGLDIVSVALNRRFRLRCRAILGRKGTKS